MYLYCIYNTPSNALCLKARLAWLTELKIFEYSTFESNNEI